MATPRSTRDPLFLGRWFQDEVIISKRRDVRAAKTLFRHALLKHGDPLSITLDAYAASHRGIAALKHEIAGLIEVQPEGGKEARAHAVSPQIESGNVYLPHPALCAWVLDYLAEWNSFPRGAHDDQRGLPPSHST